MASLNLILVGIIAVLGYPFGMLVAHMTQEELKTGRKYFRLLLTASIIAIIISAVFVRDFETQTLLISSFVFIALFSLASLKYKIRKKKRKKKKLKGE